MITSGHSTLLQTSPIARVITRFFNWWGNELSALAPAWLRAEWSRHGRFALVSINAQQLTFESASVEESVPLLVMELGQGTRLAQGAEAMQLLARRIGPGFRLALSIPPPLVLKRTARLPLAAEENLGQTLAFELDRYTPFKPEQSYFDFRVQGRDEAHKLIEVELAIARRVDVDPLLDVTRSLGLSIDSLAFAGEILGDGQPLGAGNLQRKGVSKRTGMRIVLGLTASILLVILLAIPIWQKRSAAISLLAPLAEARRAATETDSLRERLGKMAVEYNTLPQKKWSGHSLILVLDELSKRLKDDTFVTNLSFEGKSLSLQGESGSSAELVELLEASPLFEKVAFRSPLIKVPGSVFDRFHITLELSAEGLPKPTATEGSGKT